MEGNNIREKSGTGQEYRNYYSIGQLRTDVWNNLKQASDQLVQKSYKDRPPEELLKYLDEILGTLQVIERYWAFPGLRRLEYLQEILERREYTAFSNTIADLVRSLTSLTYRIRPVSSLSSEIEKMELEEGAEDNWDNSSEVHYFEVLIVDDMTVEEERNLRKTIAEVQNPKDAFRYRVVVVRTFQDALIALLFNYNIQSCVIRYGFPFKSNNDLRILKQFIRRVLKVKESHFTESEIGPALGKVIKRFRPEMDVYLLTDTSLDDLPNMVHKYFRRVFYRQEDLQEQHLSIIRGIRERYETPFFTALVEYSQRPTSVFHAMPVSRGNSIFKSHWIKDVGDFYGRNIFLAETSATTGGLDSLLQPTGALKKAQENAARAFRSKQTYFVTNGTSTANKIVIQALVHPEDVILVDRDCHKSHHYALVLSGAQPVYLDSYPIEKYSMYGAVPIEEIRDILLKYKAEGRLDKVKMLVLTNCTFDGFVYNVERVMEEILAIHPGIIFLWDEAWFAFASFSPVFRRRTGMHVAGKLSHRYRSDAYREEYQQHIESLKEGEVPRLPDPDKVKVRVYSTQSTHKTLTSLRQGSMIHVHDEEFKRKVEDAFQEAYMTHTSTSPSYQILASLDAGRRQVELEGNELVERAIERAMNLRVKVANHPLLKKYFDILTVEDFIPEEHRPSGLKRYYDRKRGWSNLDKAWEQDEFVLDPTKINLFIGRTGIDGDTFKKKFLMDQFGIQLNKTTRNTVLLMTNIGTTRSSVAFLVGVLIRIAQQIEEEVTAMNSQELTLHEKGIHSLTEELPPLPNFSHFHTAFKPSPETPEGDIRKAYFLAYNAEKCEHLPMEACEEAIDSGREVVSASFVIPYPPGFPVLVPGQVLTRRILEFMKALEVKEIHSFRPELGFRVFSDQAINELLNESSQPEAAAARE